MEDYVAFSLSKVNEIKEIAKPLSYIGIRYFSYVKYFFDNNYIYYSTDASWLKFYFQSFDSSSLTRQEVITALSTPTFISFRTGNNKTDACLSALYDHNIWNAIIFYKKDIDGVEMYLFSFGTENEIGLQWSCNNHQLFKKYIYFFRDKARDLIQLKNNKILIPLNQNIFSKEKNEFEKFIPSEESINKFLFYTKHERYFIENNGEKVYLTAREAECLSLIRDGRSLKEIANTLNLSVRTVETYFINIKNKLGIRFKSELMHSKQLEEFREFGKYLKH